MKKSICVLAVLLVVSIGLSAQEASEEASAEYIGKEIQNTKGSVRAANAGDYILLKSGRKYVLTQEEIDILRGSFNYDDLSGLETETRDDGTEVKTISEAHIVYAYPDGQFTHLLKTNNSYTSFMRHIDNKYHLALFIDEYENFYDYMIIPPRSFNVFRAIIEIQTISNGTDEMEGITISAYNHKGENYMVKYCSLPDMFWGNVSEEGAYTPVGETHQLEFDLE